MKNRREVWQLLAGALAAATAAQAVPGVSVVRNFSDVRPAPRDFGEQRSFVGNDDVSVGLTTLKPGQEPHPPHKHKEPEIIVVKEGAGQITLEGVTFQVSAGAVSYYAPGKMHGIRNTGASPLSYYVIKWSL